jgi:hypothetical protein
MQETMRKEAKMLRMVREGWKIAERVGPPVASPGSFNHYPTMPTCLGPSAAFRS